MKRIVLSFALFLTPLALAAVPAVAYAQGSDVTKEIQNGLCAGANLEFQDTSGACNKKNDSVESLSAFIRRIVNILSVIVGVVAVIMIIVGGFRYITSGGSDTSVTGAKNTILYAVIGLIIVAMAQIIVSFVLRSLSNV